MTTAKTISSIAITGDFFVYPEEKLDELELNLIGTELQRDAIMNKNREMFGRF